MPVKNRQALVDRSNVTLAVGNEVVKVLVADIRTNGGTQMRAEYNQETVTEYVAVWNSGERLPPITVYFDGDTYWLADGFHRLAAWRRFLGDSSEATIDAIVKPGTRRDAILHAAGANAEHGLRRTNADKRRAVETLLSDPEWSQWSDREIARKCKVSNQFIGNMRRELSVNSGQIESERTVERGGKTYTMQTEGIRAANEQRRVVPPKTVYADPQPEGAAATADARGPIWVRMSRPKDLADAGYYLLNRPGHTAYKWMIERVGGGQEYGLEMKTMDEAIADARRFIAARSKRNEPSAPQAKTVYVEPVPTSERRREVHPERYTIILEADAYHALRAATIAGALTRFVHDRGVRDAIMRALGEAARVP